ncbi:hypothetical protein C7B65_05565 [Phormidesmis priestleyi ULC007]|uniref:Uncharacterized protein n=1 Tax=Phormidesmis priestleyi ULC007 TaxID=1920490 RepID=A0A2T1DK47_9CYAN|nr:hypothetical protein C7B65_05565 [Phormidesmis priestleyi ULC007]PZO51833.1 MAG: hypothetical protein DCF14_07710 [Phormidesmis priestleyi]
MSFGYVPLSSVRVCLTAIAEIAELIKVEREGDVEFPCVNSTYKIGDRTIDEMSKAVKAGIETIAHNKGVSTASRHNLESIVRWIEDYDSSQ